MVSLRVRRVRRRDSGWLRIRWAIGRRKRRMNSPVHSAAITLARVARAWARWVPRATIRRGSLIASPNAAKLPISHSGRNAWWRRMCRARWRWGPSSSEKAITQMAEKQVPTTSAYASTMAMDLPSEEGRAKLKYTVNTRATSQGPSLRRAKRTRSQVRGCWGNSSVRPKRSRTRWPTQLKAYASRLQTAMIAAKPNRIAGHWCTGTTSSASSAWAWSISSAHRWNGLASPLNCFSKSCSAPPIRPSTPCSTVGCDCLVASRSFFRSASSLARCWSFSRFLITSSSDLPKGSVASGWAGALEPSRPGRPAACTGEMNRNSSRARQRRRAGTGKSTSGQTIGRV
ncbi:hypothetical protein D3C76_1012880 [compost metagenome]